MLPKLRAAGRALALAAAEFAGKTVRWLPGLAAGACFVLAAWLVAVPFGLAVAGAMCLWADWRLR